MKKILLTAAILMGFATGSYTYGDDYIYLPTHGITTNWDAENEPGVLIPDLVTISSSTATVNVDDKVMLTAIVNPTGVSNWAVTWTVGGKNAGAVKLYSDADCNHEVGTGVTTVLTVYAKGLTEGEATVTATSDDAPSLSATCTVTVQAPAPTYPVTIDDGNMDTQKWSAAPNPVESGQTVTLNYTGKKKVKNITIEKAAEDGAAPAAR